MTISFRGRGKAAVAVLATVSVMALALSGCASSTTPTSGSSSIPESGTDDGATITMWSRAPLQKQATNAVTDYNKTHKNQVKLTLLPNDDVEGKVGAAVQTGSLPDLLAGDVVRVPYWTKEGVFMDLTKQINALSNKSDLQSGHIAAGTIDGKEHTLPFVSDISVMVWNEDLFKQAGLDPTKGPSNLDDFVKDAKAVAGLNQPGVAGTYVAGESGGALAFTLFPMLWGNGDDALDKSGKKSLLASSSAQKIYSGLHELANTPNGIGAGSKTDTGATWTAPFQNGKIGVMAYPFTAVSALFKSSPFPIGVAPIPGVSSGSSTFLGGDAIGISKNSKHAAEAWNFLSWLMTEKAQKTVFADNNDTASNFKVLENDYTGADPRTLIGNATVKTGKTPIAENFNTAFNAAGSPWQILIQDAIWGDASKIKADNDAITAALGG